MPGNLLTMSRDQPGTVIPRDAATIMLLRDAPRPQGGSELQVCMLKRHIESDFVGGTYVFPGGKLDEADRSRRAASICDGMSDEEASKLLGVPRGGLAFFVAAIRECFEESGVLLARATTAHRRDVQSRDVHSEHMPGGHQRGVHGRGSLPGARELAAMRDALNSGKAAFLDLCEERGLRLAVDEVHYFSHWITPEGAPKRYDTRFFVAAMDPGQVAAHDSFETVDTVWIAPGEALERHARGELELIFPTMKNLEAISRFSSASELLDAAKAIEKVPTVLPKVVVDGRGLRILLPGDDGYEAVVEADSHAMAQPAEGAEEGLPEQVSSAPVPSMTAAEMDRVARNIGLDGRLH